jgi:hypothetical protein
MSRRRVPPTENEAMIRVIDVETDRTPADYATDTVSERSGRGMEAGTTADVAVLDGRTV